MSTYGATEQECKADAEQGKARKAMPTAPIFLENPDGTITEAVPSGFREAKPKSGRRSRERGSDGDSDGSAGSSAEDHAASMYSEVDFLYVRHERVLLFLLVTELLLEVLYNVVYVMRMMDGSSVAELVAMYSFRISTRSAEVLFWVVFAIQLVYSVVYYVVASLAVWTKRPMQYRMFANCGRHRACLHPSLVCSLHRGST
ncbi:unnamed protein product [Prorocentrum cordatum]|uniref:Uncharacterized protein n=1 Tax=Prorocentrum cordatum TaxID=2364126 RepID=A0ABN9WN72_9DINO|nr:unnamed protein product [Polarella glacialis]